MDMPFQDPRRFSYYLNEYSGNSFLLGMYNGTELRLAPDESHYSLHSAGPVSKPPGIKDEPALTFQYTVTSSINHDKSVPQQHTAVCRMIGWVLCKHESLNLWRYTGHMLLLERREVGDKGPTDGHRSGSGNEHRQFWIALGEAWNDEPFYCHGSDDPDDSHEEHGSFIGFVDLDVLDISTHQFGRLPGDDKPTVLAKVIPGEGPVTFGAESLLELKNIWNDVLPAYKTCGVDYVTTNKSSPHIPVARADPATPSTPSTRMSTKGDDKSSNNSAKSDNSMFWQPLTPKSDGTLSPLSTPEAVRRQSQDLQRYRT